MKEPHKNPPRLYTAPPSITSHDDMPQGNGKKAMQYLNLTPDEEAEAQRLAELESDRTNYLARESRLMRRNLDPVWNENVRVLVHMFKRCGGDLNLAGRSFRKWKGENGWHVSERYMYALMKHVSEKLAIAGQTDALLEEQAEDLRMLREKALEHLQVRGDLQPLLNVVDRKNKTFNLPKYYSDLQKLNQGVTININNDNKSLTQNVTVGKNRLEDYLAKLPKDKQEAVRLLALEMRKDGSLPSSIDMKGIEDVVENEGDNK